MSSDMTTTVSALFSTALLSCFLLAVWLIAGFTLKIGEMDTQLMLHTSGSDWGHVRLDLFAIRSGVHVAVARWYLSRKARQLNGVRDVDEHGDVVFLFGAAKQQFLKQHLEDREIT